MGHKIAMCQNAVSGNLNLVYLDGSGKPCTFKQTQDGVWHPTKAAGGLALQVPVQETLSFTAVKGINGNEGLAAGLLAIATDGSLWYTTQDSNDNWSTGLFIQLPNIFDDSGNICAYADVEADWVRGWGLCMATLAYNPAAPSGNWFLNVQFGGPPLNAMSQPNVLSRAGSLSIASIAVAGIDAFYSDPDRGGDEYDVPMAVIMMQGTGARVSPFATAYTCDDAVNWNTYDQTFDQIVGATWTFAALAPGNARMLQLLGLDENGYPQLVWDQSGNGSAWVGAQLPNSLKIAFSALAAYPGNDSNLQVVGIGKSDGLPYLFWQSATDGNWNECFQLPIDAAVPAISDLCMGMGTQRYLQVGYIAGGKIYVNWQDTFGNWAWYGPLP